MTAAVAVAPPSPVRAAGWAVLFLAVGFVLTVVLVAFGFFVTGVGVGESVGPRPLVLQAAGGLAGFGFATWLIGVRRLGLTATDLRWAPLSAAGRGLGSGMLLGSLPAAAAIGLSLVVGDAHFSPDDGGLGAYATQVGLTALILIPAALLEEVVFRGVALVMLARALGRLPAILVLSVTFALAHLANPNHTALGILNIAFAGVLLGLAFYLPGGIWTAWGAHFGWNATLAATDAPVSGLPFSIPMINYAPGGPAWLTGGAFGPEGGFLATVAILLASFAAWRWGERQPA